MLSSRRLNRAGQRAVAIGEFVHPLATLFALVTHIVHKFTHHQVQVMGANREGNQPDDGNTGVTGRVDHFCRSLCLHRRDNQRQE